MPRAATGRVVRHHCCKRHHAGPAGQLAIRMPNRAISYRPQRYYELRAPNQVMLKAGHARLTNLGLTNSGRGSRAAAPESLSSAGPCSARQSFLPSGGKRGAQRRALRESAVRRRHTDSAPATLLLPDRSPAAKETKSNLSTAILQLTAYRPGRAVSPARLSRSRVSPQSDCLPCGSRSCLPSPPAVPNCRPSTQCDSLTTRLLNWPATLWPSLIGVMAANESRTHELRPRKPRSGA